MKEVYCTFSSKTDCSVLSLSSHRLAKRRSARAAQGLRQLAGFNFSLSPTRKSLYTHFPMSTASVNVSSPSFATVASTSTTSLPAKTLRQLKVAYGRKCPITRARLTQNAHILPYAWSEDQASASCERRRRTLITCRKIEYLANLKLVPSDFQYYDPTNILPRAY